MLKSRIQKKAAMIKRIKPIGEVYITGETTALTKLTAAKEEAEPATVAAKPNGKDTYKSYCAVCHSSGLAGAPVKGDEKTWEPRYKKGMDKLVASSVKGLNAMPAKGTCAACSDDDLKAAIIFMLPESLQKK